MADNAPVVFDRLVPNTTRPKPDWITSLNAGCAYIWAAIALSCDINPSVVVPGNTADQKAPDLAQYRNRYAVALTNIRSGHLEIAAREDLPPIPAIMDLSVVAVDLSVFVTWAQALPCPWEMPTTFQVRSVKAAKPKDIPESPKRVDVLGVTIPLPHTTKDLDAIFQVMREFWGTYDPKNPPKQTAIASALDKALGWKPDREDRPSRNGQAVASLLRPDELKDADSRTRKRSS
jgi:hypothetical protein